ncbi:glycerol uptake operon antiterminator regulatory protein [Paenibacillus sp. J31TS4]|uniref:glycerol-3-phosphate responsive antiterminator n=1 Tax=Paenibacillus sp. J31TS4 TaxID=2807195 RepID=UPI001B266563|nr:glycerol-3-phosphate responsive antiterminator [Paenibacillus sp. J31TS4]GIP40350.1 glycerol uptake operon antiterminator regulatory protein [Paenibacillus sp. J31TS4]
MTDNEYPIIASLTKEEQIAKVIRSDIRRVNLMYGNILHLKETIDRLHKAGKVAYIHSEMVSGLGRDASAVRYLSEAFKVDGIISTKSSIIAAAKQANLKTIQRVFAIDSSALDTADKMIAASDPDEVEMMPALMPRVIREIKAKLSKPLIVGGLIRTREEIDQALANGADYVSVGSESFWHR